MRENNDELFDTGAKLIDMMDENQKLKKYLRKALRDINAMLKDNPECEYCVWFKECASGKEEKKCMESAQWKHSAAAERVLGGRDNDQ